MVTEKNKVIEKAEEKRKYLTGEAAKERIEELREKAEFDEATAYEAGKEFGEKRGKKETARSMLKDNLDKKMIVKYTGLSLKEIEKIAL